MGGINFLVKGDGTIITPNPNIWSNNHDKMLYDLGITENNLSDDYIKVKMSPINYGPSCYRTNPMDVELWGFSFHNDFRVTRFTEDKNKIITKCRKAALEFMKKVPLGVADYDVLIGGRDARLNGGNYNNINGGDAAVLNGLNFCNITGGFCSIITGLHYCNLTGGEHSTITGWDQSILTGGDRSTFVSHYFGKRGWRVAVAEVGEDGIKPNTPYKVTSTGKFREVRKKKGSKK